VSVQICPASHVLARCQAAWGPYGPGGQVQPSQFTDGSDLSVPPVSYVVPRAMPPGSCAGYVSTHHRRARATRVRTTVLWR
jgi:hypothetical protein